MLLCAVLGSWIQCVGLQECTPTIYSIYGVIVVVSSLKTYSLGPHGLYSTPGSSVFHCILEFAQFHVP